MSLNLQQYHDDITFGNLLLKRIRPLMMEQLKYMQI